MKIRKTKKKYINMVINNNLNFKKYKTEGDKRFKKHFYRGIFMLLGQKSLLLM